MERFILVINQFISIILVHSLEFLMSKWDLFLVLSFRERKFLGEILSAFNFDSFSIYKIKSVNIDLSVNFEVDVD